MKKCNKVVAVAFTVSVTVFIASCPSPERGDYKLFQDGKSTVRLVRVNDNSIILDLSARQDPKNVEMMTLWPRSNAVIVQRTTDDSHAKSITIAGRLDATDEEYFGFHMDLSDGGTKIAGSRVRIPRSNHEVVEYEDKNGDGSFDVMLIKPQMAGKILLNESWVQVEGDEEWYRSDYTWVSLGGLRQRAYFSNGQWHVDNPPTKEEKE